MQALENATEHAIDTPFGRPSDVVVPGEIEGVGVAFIARHGRGHRLIPTEVPYRANIYAFKKLGVKYVISLSAVGSLSQEMKPLDMVLPDQYIDLTSAARAVFLEVALLRTRLWPSRCARYWRTYWRVRCCKLRPKAKWGPICATPRRNLRVHRGTTVLIHRRIALVPKYGCQSGGHDEYARGQTGQRGANGLRQFGDGDRF